jgi:hypothetical protein
MDVLSAGGAPQANAAHGTAGSPHICDRRPTLRTIREGRDDIAQRFSRQGDGIGHRPGEAHGTSADPTPSRFGGGDGPALLESHDLTAVATIVALWRQRQDLARARQRLDLQCQAVVRRYSDGDKDIAAKRWAAIQKGAGDEVAPILIPYQLAMEPLEEARAALEKQLSKRAAALPLWSWAKDVRGLGALSLAGLVGEAGLPLGDYRSVSGLWKRMGLAVIGGGRQRKVAQPDLALLHGYAPQRRSYAYVLSTNLIRAQRDGDPYRAIYDARKAYELAREIPKAHAHNRALRVMVKALLRDAWAADRRLSGRPAVLQAETNELSPVASQSEEA